MLAEPGRPVISVTPGRAIGSVLLSETVVVLVVIAGVVIPVLTLIGAGPVAAVSFVPIVIGSITVLARRIGRNLRFSVVSTPDGVRVASGIISTSTEAVPPGRVHALHVEQPLLWRPAGWWRVSVNRAGHAAGRRNAESERSLAPVATTEEVLALLPLPRPGPRGQPRAAARGLVGRGRDEDFTAAPRRARWLRPLAWRRTGFRLTEASILARSGFLRRELVVVPDARMQSVSLRQGPFERLLRVATVHPHVVLRPGAHPPPPGRRRPRAAAVRRARADRRRCAAGRRLAPLARARASREAGRATRRRRDRRRPGGPGARRRARRRGARAGRHHRGVAGEPRPRGRDAARRARADRSRSWWSAASWCSLAVPDSELAALVEGLAEAGVWVAGQLVVHTAPGFGTGVLLPAVRRGAIPVALSPAMAFTGTSVDLVRLREARCAVTAPTPVLPIGQALAVEMGCEPVVVAEDDRAAWAAALDDAVGPVERGAAGGRCQADAARGRGPGRGARAGGPIGARAGAAAGEAPRLGRGRRMTTTITTIRRCGSGSRPRGPRAAASHWCRRWAPCTRGTWRSSPARGRSPTSSSSPCS